MSPIADAEAYAKWAGKELPTEAEWEFAARGGLDGAEFAWGDELTPAAGRWPTPGRATFPHENLQVDGYERTSPVGAFPPNGYGLYDMIGNVWEWTTDWYRPKHPADAPQGLLHPGKPARRPARTQSYDPCQPQIRIPRKVLKGGSHLCAPNYCRRYRPAARTRSRSTPRPATSASDAWCAERNKKRHEPSRYLYETGRVTP